MIKTIEQARAAIRKLESANVVTHEMRVKSDKLRQALQDVELYSEWRRHIREDDARGDAVAVSQATRDLENWMDTRMTSLAARLINAMD